jgi:hypothetical protein
MDGAVLANLIRVCFECALKRNELIDLTIEDVSEGGVIKDIVKVGDKDYKITDTARDILQYHLHLLKTKNYKLYPSWPLFPSKKGNKYSEKNLTNHLNKYFKSEPHEISLEIIRQAGICNHYFKNKKIMINEDNLKNTKDFVRAKSFRHVKDILRGEIQPAGKKPDKLIDYLKVIEELSINAQNESAEIDKVNYQELQKQIMGDFGLSSTERDDLIEVLKCEVDKSKQNKSNHTSKHKSQYKSVTDFVQKSIERKKISIKK